MKQRTKTKVAIDNPIAKLYLDDLRRAHREEAEKGLLPRT